MSEAHRAAAAVALVLVHGAAAATGVFPEGVAAATAQAALAAAASLVAFGAAWGGARLVAGGVPGGRVGGALAVVGLVALAASPFAAVAALPFGFAGWLAGKGSPHASDAAFGGALAALALGVASEASWWGEGARFLVPVALVTLALLLRELWDLADLAAAARARLVGAPPDAAPDPGPVVAAEARWAAAVVVAGGALAAVAGFAREPLRAALAGLGAPGAAAFLLALVLAPLAVAVRLLAPARVAEK